VQLPLAALRTQLASAVDVIVQTSRLAGGARKVTHVTEVAEFSQSTGAYVVQDLYTRVFRSDSRGALRDELVPTGSLPVSLSRIEEHGLKVPASMIDAAHHRSKGGTHA
jgi:pilus assembly protein CpaF